MKATPIYEKNSIPKTYLAALADYKFGDYHGIETTTITLQSIVGQSLS